MPVRDTDAAMNAASDEARNALPIFWKLFDRRAAGFDHFQLKAVFPAPGGGEAMWVDPKSHNGEDIVGVLDDDPVLRTDLKRGVTVRLKTSDIDDWSYGHNGKLWGNFTTPLLLRQMTPNEAAKMRSILGPTRLEPGV